MLGYWELPESEVPDESIWHHSERLDEWFEAVRQRRENGLQPIDEAEETEMVGNELARELMGD